MWPDYLRYPCTYRIQDSSFIMDLPSLSSGTFSSGDESGFDDPNWPPHLCTPVQHPHNTHSQLLAHANAHTLQQANKEQEWVENQPPTVDFTTPRCTSEPLTTTNSTQSSPPIPIIPLICTTTPCWKLQHYPPLPPTKYPLTTRQHARNPNVLQVWRLSERKSTQLASSIPLEQMQIWLKGSWEAVEVPAKSGGQQ